jgi:hypothetical protein
MFIALLILLHIYTIPPPIIPHIPTPTSVVLGKCDNIIKPDDCPFMYYYSPYFSTHLINDN